jgi:hypothetical protein
MPDVAPIGALFALGKLVEEEERAAREAVSLRKLFGIAEPEPEMPVTFLTEYEPKPVTEPPKYGLLAHIMAAGVEAWHKGSEARH